MPVLSLCLALVAAPALLAAQSASFSTSLVAADPMAEGGAGQATSPVLHPPIPSRPFSRIAVGGGFSPLGINLMAATNLNNHFSLRGTGNFFNYDVSNITTNGFSVDAKLNLASAGASLDFYPFPSHGLRLSPGVLFYNTNQASAAFSVAGGTSFTLDNVTYYTSSIHPVKGSGTLNLHSQSPAFTIAAGWGNVFPRKGGHWSFPVEVGVALAGAPVLTMALTSGQVCDARGANCVDVATDLDVKNHLKTQIGLYNSDLDPLKTYPIVSFGVAYAFHIR